jgi:hypothetical protein
VDDSIENRRAAAQAELDSLLARGVVRRVFLFPEMFGGTDDPRNVTWLPLTSIKEKEQFDSQVRDAVDRGEVVHYTATPSFGGISKVPIRLTLTAKGTKLNLRKVIEVELHKTRQWAHG